MIQPTYGEWLAARKRLGRYRKRSPHTIDELVEAVLGPCPPEPVPREWRLVSSPERVMINPFREEWLAARDRVTALFRLLVDEDTHWDEDKVVTAVLGPCPPKKLVGVLL